MKLTLSWVKNWKQSAQHRICRERPESVLPLQSSRNNQMKWQKRSGSWSQSCLRCGNGMENWMQYSSECVRTAPWNVQAISNEQFRLLFKACSKEKAHLAEAIHAAENAWRNCGAAQPMPGTLSPRPESPLTCRNCPVPSQRKASCMKMRSNTPNTHRRKSAAVSETSTSTSQTTCFSVGRRQKRQAVQLYQALKLFEGLKIGELLFTRCYRPLRSRQNLFPFYKRIYNKRTIYKSLLTE